MDSFYYNYVIENPDTSNYYSKFWNRRKAEGNAEMLFVILEEIKQIYETNASLPFEEKAINDTIYSLMSYEYRSHKKLYENEPTNRFSATKLNRDSMNKSLNLEEIPYEKWLPMYQEGKGYWIFKSFTEN